MKHYIILTSVAAILALVAAVFISFSPHITYNPSPSAPLGWYTVEQISVVQKGDYLLMNLPESARKMASNRHYLPSDIPLLKHVFATFGDTICMKEGVVYVNEKPVAKALPVDSKGRAMPQLSLCRRLALGEYFLLNPDISDSFDSRYFGPITTDLVIGKAVPLWTWTEEKVQ